MPEFISGISLVYGLIAFVLAVVWLVLPFAVFGIKGRLDRISSQLQAIEGILDPKGDRAPLHNAHTLMRSRGSSQLHNSEPSRPSDNDAAEQGHGP